MRVNKSASSLLENLFLALPPLHNQHAPGSKVYILLKQVARREVEQLFSNRDIQTREFQPFGDLIFPYHRMGAVDSLNLFDLDELIIFSFYWVNRNRYRRVVDIGANIGLHSIILNKCGFAVKAFEPDPKHYDILQRNLSLNKCNNIEVYNIAVSNKMGTMDFVRVLGNTTGSHLAGSKESYGDLELISVRTESISPLLAWADLIKMDVEGHESEIILSTHYKQWLQTDALIEVGNQSNAEAIYEHFTKCGVRMFSQKNHWRLVRNVQEMPMSYRDGTLFITTKQTMPWPNN